MKTTTTLIIEKIKEDQAQFESLMKSIGIEIIPASVNEIHRSTIGKGISRVAGE